jgi:hypothetical protein
MAKRNAIVEALRLARKRYADGGEPTPAAAPAADVPTAAPQPQQADFQAYSTQQPQGFNPQYGSPVDFGSLASSGVSLFGPPQFDPSSRSLAGFPDIERLRYSQLPPNPNFKPTQNAIAPTLDPGSFTSFDGSPNIMDPFLTMQFPFDQTTGAGTGPSSQQGAMDEPNAPIPAVFGPDNTFTGAPIMPVEATDLPPPTANSPPEAPPAPVPAPAPGFGNLGTQFDVMGNVTIPAVGTPRTPVAPAPAPTPAPVAPPLAQTPVPAPAPVPVAPAPVVPAEPTEAPPQTPDQIFQQNDPLSNLDQSGLTPEPAAPAAPPPAPAPTPVNPVYGQLVAPGQIPQEAPPPPSAPQPVVQQPDIVQQPQIGSNIDPSQIDQSLVGPTEAGQQFLESFPVQGPPAPPPTSVSDFNQIDFIAPPATPPDAVPPETIPPISIQEADPNAMSNWQTFSDTSGLSPDEYNQMMDNYSGPIMYETDKRGGRIKPHINKALKITERKRGGKVSAYQLKPDSEDRKHAGYSKDGGKMQWMTPDKFLEQSQEMQMDKGDKKAIKKFKKKLKKGKELNPLALYPSGGQDGRHRATAAKELGIDKVPVITWPGKNSGRSITDRALMVTSKSVNHQRGRP